jgi:uncharacterized membrane protein (DUF106 family)
MYYISRLLTSIFHLVMTPMVWAVGKFLALMIISAGAGVFLLFIFGRTSDQVRLKQVKREIRRYILEIRLYRDDLAIIGQALVRLLGHNMRYFGVALKPMLIMLIPVSLLLIQLAQWYQYDPLPVNQPAVLSLTLSPKAPAGLIEQIRLVPSPDFVMETAPLKFPLERSIHWRIRPTRRGVYQLNFETGGAIVSKSCIVGVRSTAIVPRRHAGHLIESLLEPGESALPAALAIESIRIDYPLAPGPALLGGHISWLLIFFIVSLISGLLVKGRLKVEI